MSEQNAVLYWPYTAHIPIVQAVTYPKKGIYQKGWNEIDFTKVDFEAELKKGEYDNGIALILGKTMLPINGNGKAKNECCYYSFALDFDGYDAVEEWFGGGGGGSWDYVIELSKKTRIEWHQDKGRIHIIFMAKRPIANKQISIKDSKLEVRCEKQPLFSSPSIHETGIPWTVLGIDEIIILNDIQLLQLEAKIDQISQGYMSDENKQMYIEWLEDPKTKIKEHEGRHPATKTLGCSYFYRYNNGWKDLSQPVFGIAEQFRACLNARLARRYCTS